MKLDQNSGSIITEVEARNLIGAFKNQYPSETTSSFIGIENIKKIINQTECMGIRVHQGFDTATQTMSLVLVGVDVNEKEMLTDGIIYDEMIKCPHYCPIDGLGF